ncbi:MAG: hypothetical protein BGO76_02465 [Caedibacter sp. 38-128]|nr:LysR family transcriptional regulator [Holosporales bacterium]OJX07008.1 MAG: hypothetical protein BGO76_02465 [Caedibacter sp. 38-128]
MIDINQLATFYYVAKTRSFSLAETYTGFKQSWMSRQIKDLETKLGNKLLTRHHGSVSLTPDGEVFFESAKKIIQEAKIIETLLNDSHKEPKGKLRIVTSVASAYLWLPKYMAGFLEKYPDMRLNIIGSNENIDLDFHDADVAIRPYTPESEHLIHTYLLSYPLKLYASPKYLEKFGIPQTIEDLDHHRIIAFSSATKISFGDVDWHLNIGCKKGVKREPFMQVNSPLGLATLAQEGLGIISISKFQQATKGMDLIEVLPDLSGPIIDIYYVYPKELKDFKRITVLGDYLVHMLEQESKLPNTVVLRRPEILISSVRK